MELEANRRLNTLAAGVNAAFNRRIPLSVRYAAARAADKVVTDWHTARDEDDNQC